MDSDGPSRRSALGRAIGALALGVAPAASSKPAFAAADLDLADPKVRTLARAKAIGSISEETVYTFYRLHIYGYFNDGNLVPFFTMNNLSITKWRPLANGHFQSVGAECGVYCRFDSDDVLDVWQNPVTLEKRPVWEFLGGPLKAEIGPDGVSIGGVGEIKPNSLRLEAFGDMLFIANQSDLAYPSPFDPKLWPKDSAGATNYWDSHFLCAAKLEDILNPRLTSAPAFCQFQNMGSFHPWLGMGGHPGRTYGKAYGAKLKSLDEVPPAALAGIRKKTPQIFDAANWTEPRIDFKDFMATHKPA